MGRNVICCVLLSNSVTQETQAMTLKEQLFQALDSAPDHILEQMLSDLRRLQVQPAIHPWRRPFAGYRA
jgi:hypothetical protein